MKIQKPLNEPVLYLVALSLALIVRLMSLGKTMLTDYEAGLALQALAVVRGGHPLIGDQPAYVQLTSLLFFLFGSGSQFLARFWPALLGSLVVLIPIGFRGRIGKIPALILAFGLALDPGLLAMSRQVGSPILAVVGLWLGISLGTSGYIGAAGILLGLALMGGPSFWLGSIGLGTGWLISRQFVAGANGLENEYEHNGRPVVTKPLMKLLFYGLGTILLIGSLFFNYPRGLSGIFEGLRSFLAGWASSSAVSPFTLLLALVVYQPLAFFFGLWGTIRGWRRMEAVDQTLSVIAALSLFLVLVYPARQIADLSWVLVPLWGLAAREISRHLEANRNELVPAVGQAVLALVMAVFIWLNLTGLVMSIGNTQSTNLYTGFILGAVLLIILISILIGWGWSSRVARFGLVWGLTGALVLYSGSTATAVGGYRDTYTSNLWLRDASIPRADLLLDSVNNFSRWQTGVVNNLDVQVVGVPSPALQWLLRDYPGARFSDQLSVSLQPSLVITAKAQEPALAAAYRGEELTWYQSTNWSLMLPGDTLRWIVFQTSMSSKTSIVLWARTDVFQGGAAGNKQNVKP